LVAVKNHYHGVTTEGPDAVRNTVEQVLAAPIVVEPFGLYEHPAERWRSAAILVAEELADRSADRPEWVRGTGLGLDRVMHQLKRNMTSSRPRSRPPSRRTPWRRRPIGHRRRRSPRLLHRHRADQPRRPLTVQEVGSAEADRFRRYVRRRPDPSEP
jgi:hypothetical protein